MKEEDIKYPIELSDIQIKLIDRFIKECRDYYGDDDTNIFKYLSTLKSNRIIGIHWASNKLFNAGCDKTRLAKYFNALVDSALEEKERSSLKILKNTEKVIWQGVDMARLEDLTVNLTVTRTEENNTMTQQTNKVTDIQTVTLITVDGVEHKVESLSDDLLDALIEAQEKVVESLEARSESTTVSQRRYNKAVDILEQLQEILEDRFVDEGDE